MTCSRRRPKLTDYLVVAFGGNAITPSGQRGTLDEQRQNVRRMAGQLGELIVEGHRVVVTHGNGPQVGEIMLKSELTREVVPPLTLDVAGRCLRVRSDTCCSKRLVITSSPTAPRP